MNEAIEEITKKQVTKKEAMYNRIEIDLQGVKQELQLSHAASTAPLPEGTTKEGDEPVQLCRIADTVKVCLWKEEEETVQATQALKQEQEEILEQRRAAQQEKEAIHEKFDGDREKIQKEKEQLLAKQVGIE